MNVMNNIPNDVTEMMFHPDYKLDKFVETHLLQLAVYAIRQRKERLSFLINLLYKIKSE